MKMDEKRLIEEQKSELLRLMVDDDFTNVIYAMKLSPPDRFQEVNVYGKERLKLENFVRALPVRKIIHHRDGDVTFVHPTKGCFRFLNTGAFNRDLMGMMRVVHDY